MESRQPVKCIYFVCLFAAAAIMIWAGINNKSFDAPAGTFYDTGSGMNRTEDIALLSGEYVVTLDYDAPGDVTIFLYRDNSGEVFPIELSGDEGSSDFSLYLERYSGNVHIAYEGGTDALTISNINISSTGLINYDLFVLAVLLLLMAIPAWYLAESGLEPVILLTVLGCVLISTAILAYRGIPGRAEQILPAIIRTIRTGMPLSVALAYCVLVMFAAANICLASVVIHGRISLRTVILYFISFTLIVWFAGGSMKAAFIVSVIPQLAALIAIILKKNRRGYMEVLSGVFEKILTIIRKAAADLSGSVNRACVAADGDQRIQIIVFLLLFGCFLLSRLYKLDGMIDAINADEIGSGYDALCIRDYGVDRWTIRMPVYFKNYSSGQNALYTYLAAIVFSFTDFSLYALRLPAVICATLGFVSLYILSGLLFHRYIYRVVTMIFMIIWPVFFMSERWALESYLLHSLLFVSMMFLCLAIESGKAGWFVAAGLAFGVCLYTYAIAYIVEPVFLLFAAGYLIWLKKVRVRDVILCAVPFFLLALPLALEQLVNARIIAPFTFWISDFVPMRRFRGEEFRLDHIWENIKICHRLITADDRPYNGSAKYGTMYYLSVPFILIGALFCLKRMIDSFRKKEYHFETLVFVLFVISFAESLTVLKLNINRSNEIYVCFLLFAVYGLICCCEHIRWLGYILAAAYAIVFCFFLNYYFNGELMNDIWSSEAHAILWESVEVGEAARDLTLEYGDRKKLHIMSRLDDTKDAELLLLAAYEGISPYEFSKDRENNGKYSYGEITALDTAGGTIYLVDENYEETISQLEDAGYDIDRERYDDFIVAEKRNMGS